jgi:BioD-like phosphotransacetylase family protein
VGRILLLEIEKQDPSKNGEEPQESAAGILLTGPRLPSQALLDGAREAGIALLHCPLDRFAALERLQHILVSVRVEERYKKERFAELLVRDLGIPDILACSAL